MQRTNPGPSSPSFEGCRAGRQNSPIALSLPPLTPRSRRRLLALIAAGAFAGGLLAALLGGGRPPLLVPRQDLGARDPLAFVQGQEGSLERAAALGLAHVLYAKSPGGVLATAARTARFRPLVESAAGGDRDNADLLEAIVFLESGGRPDIIAGPDPARAAGLTQILAETGRNFLKMRVDLEASRKLTGQIRAAVRRGDGAAAERLRERRRRVDARFDPERALAGTMRYLAVARRRFGRDDLAVVSYHMGIGNLEAVLRDHADARGGPIRDTVAEEDLSWARVYFDSSPIRHAPAWRRLSRLGDDSETYYWRVLAAKEIMRLFSDDRRELERLADLHGRKASAEEVLHPPDTTERFREPTDVERAWKKRLLQPLPDEPERLHFRIDPGMGELAPRVVEEPELYRGLRPEALALLLYLADRVHALSGVGEPLTVTSTVRDDVYQRLLGESNPEATASYSLHTTGFAFDVLRRYASPAQAAAFQYELERLQALDLIAWVREPAAIHVTVSSDAGSVLVPARLEEAGSARASAPSTAR